MISIDGSEGEGGGQILRTSIALSALTQKPVKIFNIRAKRDNPGLRAQHLTSILAVGKICRAEMLGVELGSKKIEFIPGEIEGGHHSINIGTAGAITLVLQALMIPAMKAKKEVKIKVKGGTDVRWSPPIDYLRYVTLPLLKKFGYLGEIELIQRGYYPKGGGEVLAKITPVKLRPINLMGPGKPLSLEGISHAHSDLEKAKVARRQMRTVRSLLYNKLCQLNPELEVNIRQEYGQTPSYGSGITLFLRTENSILGADSLGEKGKSSEIVGQEAAKNLIQEINSQAPLDKYMGDQIIPYLALATGSVKASEVTQHTKTNISIVKKFGYNLKLEGNVISSD